MGDWIDLMRIRYKRDVPEDRKQTADIARNHKHIEQLGAHLVSLIGTIEDIRVVRAFISRLPPKNYLAKHELTAMKYYEYQYNSFLHRVSTVVDLMRLIANDAFQVGLRPKDCSWKELLKSTRFAKSKMRGIIDSCYSKLRRHIELRNHSTHRGEIKHDRMRHLEAELSFIERMRGTQRFNALPEEVQRYYHPVYVKYRVRTFRQDLLDEIDLTEQIILNHLRNFLACLSETERFPK